MKAFVALTLITLAVPAPAQLRLPQLPGVQRLPGVVDRVVDRVVQPLPELLSSTTQLVDLRVTTVRDLLQRHPDVVEADPRGEPIRRRELVLLSPSEAALAAGFNYQHFDFDLVHVATLVGTDAGGRGKIGERGAWMSTGGPYIIAHELGHNLGWNHANLWSTGSPNTFSLATHLSITRGEELNAYLRDPDGLIGHESIYGPGEEREYGDPFDVMGGGNEGAVNAIFQYGVGWLPDASLTTATTNGTYRLHAFDRDEIDDGRTYLLRMGDILLQGRAQRTYWIQYRYNLGNMPPGNGVLSASGTSPKRAPGTRQPSVRSMPSNSLTTSILPARTA